MTMAKKKSIGTLDGPHIDVKEGYPPHLVIFMVPTLLGGEESLEARPYIDIGVLSPDLRKKVLAEAKVERDRVNQYRVIYFKERESGDRSHAKSKRLLSRMNKLERQVACRSKERIDEHFRSKKAQEGAGLN